MRKRKVLRKKNRGKRKQKRMKKPVDIDKRPAWDSCSQDMSKYKLSRMEYVHLTNTQFLLSQVIKKGNENL